MEKAMIYYAGLDVSLRTVNICVIDEQGELLAETKLASDVQDIVAYLDDLEFDVESVGLEAGTLMQYLTYGLQAAGFEVVCMEARQVKGALSAMRNKTDKHDARGIAQILRSGWYSRVHVKSVESHHIRMLLSSRKAVLSKCVACSRSSASSYHPSLATVLSTSQYVTLSKLMRSCHKNYYHCLMHACFFTRLSAYSITALARWRMPIRSAFDS